MLTGKGLTYGGSLARTEATGYGLCYFTRSMLKCNGRQLRRQDGRHLRLRQRRHLRLREGQQLGAKVVAMSDSNGWIYDPNGIDLALVKQIKEVERGRIKEYAKPARREYHEGQRRLEHPLRHRAALRHPERADLDDARPLVKNGCKVVAEGANMPTTPRRDRGPPERGVPLRPGKAANAGGVATSGLEMCQNSMRLSWTFEEVDAKLQGIMESIYHNAYDAAKEYGHEGNLVMGANIAGFLKVADAMMAQGIV